MEAKSDRNKKTIVPQRVDTGTASAPATAAKQKYHRPKWCGTTLCVHCAKRIAWKAGRLCSSCHADAFVRAKYVKPQAPGNFLPKVGAPLPPLPSEPTTAVPGSIEKFHVLCARAAAGVQLWHPDDSKDTDASPGIDSHKFSFSAGADTDSNTGDEPDALTDVLCVDSRNHRWAAVPELMGDLIRREAGFDAIAGVGVAQAVRRHTIDNAVIEATPFGRAAEMVRECRLLPGVAVAVRKDVRTFRDPSQRSEKPHSERTQTHNPGHPGSSHGLVLDQIKVRSVWPVDSYRVPGKLPHLARPAAGVIQEDQRELQRPGTEPNQSAEFFMCGWAPSLSYQPPERSRARVGTGRDQFFFLSPTEAREHSSDAAPLCRDCFPAWMSTEPFGQVVLSESIGGFVAEHFQERIQVSLVTFAHDLTQVASFDASFAVSEVEARDIADGFHGNLLGRVLNTNVDCQADKLDERSRIPCELFSTRKISELLTENAQPKSLKE